MAWQRQRGMTGGRADRLTTRGSLQPGRRLPQRSTPTRATGASADEAVQAAQELLVSVCRALGATAEAWEGARRTHLSHFANDADLLVGTAGTARW